MEAGCCIEASGGELADAKRQRACSPAGWAMDLCPDVAQGATLGDGLSEMVSLHQALDRLAQEHGSRPAVLDEQGTSWTYAELQDASLRMATGIAGALPDADGLAGAAGAAPRPVALLMRRNCAWVAACIAGARLRMPVLALSGDLGTEEEVQRSRKALAEHRPAILVLDAALRGGAAAAPVLDAERRGDVLVVDAASLLQTPTPAAPPPVRGTRSADDVLFLVYTGGTTSASKCVAVTHRMALHELVVYPQVSPLRCTDRVLHQTSAYWGATSLGIFDIPWACGACLVLAEGGAGPADVTRAIQKYGITVAGLVPSVLEALEEEPCRSLRVVFTWGEAMAPSTAARWAPRVALLDLLIASEYWLILYADHRNTIAAGFRPVPGARLTLRPPEREDTPAASEVAEVGEGEVGELFLAGPMVSAVGYADASRNEGAFVELPVGPEGQLVRHFRTRDLARKRPDGALEYCGRADGFAKVGGKWLDLASVERQLVTAGCKEAALVWDENAKVRHAAVVLENKTPPANSLSARTAELQRLLPKETRLHLLAEFPHNPATGKIHRGVLVNRLAAAVQVPDAKATPRGIESATWSLAIGLLLAARAGVRGALLLPLAWSLAPGLLSAGADGHGFLSSLPEGLAWAAYSWARWYQALSRCLTSSQLTTLPHIALLLMDTPSTGLESFAGLTNAPIGTFGTALLITRWASPLLRALLVAAARLHAKRARGGSGWLWAFWLGAPSVADAWQSDLWQSAPHGATPEDEASAAVRALSNVLQSLKAKTISAAKLPTLQRCYYCNEWAIEGGLWKGEWYCKGCTVAYDTYQIERAENGQPGSAGSTPVDSPRENWSPRGHWSHFGHPTTNGAAQQAPTCDELTFADYEVRIAAAHMPKSGAANGRTQTSVAASPVARIVERVTGVDVTDLQASLASLESLKVIGLVSALRRDLKLDLAAVDVSRCASLDELEQLCAATGSTTAAAALGQAGLGQGGGGPAGSSSGDERGETEWAIYAIPRFWRAPVGWLIRLDEVPEEGAMRAACRALVRRHAGLRARPYGTVGDENVAQLCNGGAPIVVTLRRLLGSRFGGSRGGIVDQAVEGLLQAWPRVRCATPEGAGPAAPPDDGGDGNVGGGGGGPGGGPLRPEEAAHFEWQRLATEADLRHAAFLRARSRGFKLPASIGCLVLEGGGANGDVGSESNGASSKDVAYLHIAVNHAVTDAASIVPMVVDLLELHRAAREVLQSGTIPAPSTGCQPRHAEVEAWALAALATAKLPPAPNGMAAQQARLRAALLAAGSDDARAAAAVTDATEPGGTAQAGADGAGALDLTHSAFNPRRPGYDHYVRLLPNCGKVLEVASKVLGAPSDHLLVAAIGLAFAQIAARDEVKLSLIAPMRDGRGEGQAVGNMASTRHLTLFVGGGRSVGACALELSGRLRRREWELCDVLGDDGDRVFINVRGIPGFDGATPVIERVDVKRKPTKFVRNIIEMFADQETPEQWTLWMGIREDFDGSALAKAMRRVIWGLASNPLQPLHSGAAAAAAAAPAAA